jgi:nicotine blue oxidoreductase
MPDPAPRPAAAIVLAAGAGRRAGGPKAEFVGHGQRLVDRAVELVRAAGCAPVLAVVRPGTSVPGARVVVNPDPDRGIGSSLRVGLAAAAVTTADRVVVVLVDQPDLAVGAVARLADAAADTPALWFATFDGRRAHPVRIDRPLWAAVAAVAAGDEGARGYARTHPESVREVRCDGLGSAVDLDTADELQAWASGSPPA